MGIHVKYTDQHFYFVYNFILISLFVPLVTTHQPPGQWMYGLFIFLGGEVMGSEVEQPGHEADHSPASSAEVMNE